MSVGNSMGWTIIVLLIGIAAIGSNSLVLSPILTDIAVDLATEPDKVARAAAAYGGATALAAFFLGRVVDDFGPRPVLIVGSIGLASGTLASAIAATWWHLAAAQAVAGVAAGAMIPAIYARATTMGTPEQGAKALGFVLTGWSVSLVLGVPASAVIADSFGWRAAYLALTGVVVVSWVGFVMIGNAQESTADMSEPASKRTALKIPGIALLLAIQFLFMWAFYGIYPFFGDHLRMALGFSASEVGFVVLFYGVGFGFAGLSNRIFSGIGPLTLLLWVLVWAVLVYVGMNAAMTTMPSSVIVAMVWGFGNHLIVGLVVRELSQRAGAQRGAVLGLNSSITYLASMAGPLVFGPVYVAYGFGILALLAAVSLGLAALIAFRVK